MRPFRDTVYSVTEFGRVLNTKTKRWLKSFIGTDGYLYLNLNYKRYSVHRIVAEVYSGEVSENLKLEVNHIDGNKFNNHFLNLEWCTRSHNVKHSYKNGLQKKKLGEANVYSKLNKPKVMAIRSLYESGDYSYSELAKEFTVSISAIARIITRKTWKHVE